MKRLPLIALIFLLFFSLVKTVQAQTQTANLIRNTHFELKQRGFYLAKMSVWWDSKTQGHFYYQTPTMAMGQVSGFSVPDDAINVGVSLYVFGGEDPKPLSFPNGLKGISAVCAYGELIFDMPSLEVC